ncbi:putative Sec24B protein, partial [Operophtera brumata]
MKLLPLYTRCMLRSDALAGGECHTAKGSPRGARARWPPTGGTAPPPRPDLSCDDRSCAMYRALTADVLTSLVYTYPRLLPLHDADCSARPHQLR